MDINYLLFLQSIREAVGGIFNSFMMQMTVLGEATAAFLLLAAVYWCLDKRSGQLMALNSAFGLTLNQFLKSLIHVDRPWVRDSRITPVEDAMAEAKGYSFPSGHTHRATAIWGSLGASLWKKKQKAASLICWIVLVLIGFSRNYLGVHTPQDVLVALATGIILIFVLDKVLTWADKNKNRDFIVTGIGLLVIILAMVTVGWISFAGLGFGFLIGWVLERHFINFNTNGTFINKCMRFAIGGAGILYILLVVKSMLNLVMESTYADFITWFLMALFIMFLYPFFFSKKERYKWGIATIILILALTLVFSSLCVN